MMGVVFKRRSRATFDPLAKLVRRTRLGLRDTHSVSWHTPLDVAAARFVRILVVAPHVVSTSRS